MSKSTIIKGIAGRLKKKKLPRKRKTEALRNTLQLIVSLQPATGAGLLILAAVAAYLNYLAAADMLSAGMVLWQGKTAAATVAIAIGTTIMLFWSYVFSFLPLVRKGKHGRAMRAVVAFGCAMILCLSCWMNAAALAGVRAQERDLAIRLSQYREAFDEVLRGAMVVRQLQPVLDAESSRFAGMSKTEKESGALTGSRSPGAVTATLDQVSGRLTSLRDSVLTSLKEADQGAQQARRHLKSMQDLLGAQGEFDKRLSAFAEHASELDAIMAQLSEQSVLPAIKQTTRALDASLVLPATSARSQDLAAKQEAVMEGVAAAVREVGVRLSGAASAIEQHKPVALPPFMPLSRADAIVHYALDFLPAWVAAASIDLMPLAIALILTIVRASEEEERNGAPPKPREPAPKPAAAPEPASDPEDFEEWLERRPGGLSGRFAGKGDGS